MERRRVLACVGGFGMLVSGCLGRGSEPAQSAEPATRSPTSTETPADPCRGDFDRIGYSGTVKRGPIGVFDLSVSPESVPLGGQLTVRLENAGNTPRTTEAAVTGIKNKYIIERQIGDGWQSVFWEADRETAVWNDEGIHHAPGEGFTWHLTLTRSGLEQGFYHVCEPLRAGTYRFVYFGMGDDPALGAEFTVTRN
ncbi:MAG: hypothetical protein ABEH66_07955 [Halobacteriales archaeon]